MAHSQTIYLNEKNKGLLNPFSFQVDPMERLLLVNFESDPDVIYKGFEPQYFDDQIHGKGLLVIGWRNDLKVDVYHEPGLKLREETYDIAGKGLNQMSERNFESAVCEILDAGVYADIIFEDNLGRKVEIRILEQHPKKRNPFGLLAPMGDAAENPSAMPLVYVHDFYFVRRRHSNFQLKIDGKHHKPDKFPIPLDGTWMYFTRYSGDPFIVTFNPAIDGNLKTMENIENQKVKNGSTELELSENGPAMEIKKMTEKTSNHEINVVFAPAFPQLNLLRNSVEVSGVFSIKGHSSTGRIGGEYHVKKYGNKISIILEPSEGWIPNESKLTIRFLYAVVKIFKHWPKTYRWTAELEEVDGSWEMKSDWKRLK
ncbi:hypothetical protein [Aquiflexum sp.]|uniref:hypothetical protein n=1 Tax=Aquiflexum sp. TaxID=1872584 RepID=UPI003593F42D